MKCPHCSTAFAVGSHTEMIPLTTEEVWNSGRPGLWDWRVLYSECPECQKDIIRLMAQETVINYDRQGRKSGSKSDFLPPWLVYPRSTFRPPAPPEVSQEFAEDYREACLVLADSPKASAALSRRCLQGILREKAGVKHSSLHNEIQEVLNGGTLPSHLADDIDAVRNIGNFAAHPIKS